MLIGAQREEEEEEEEEEEWVTISRPTDESCLVRLTCVEEEEGEILAYNERDDDDT